MLVTVEKVAHDDGGSQDCLWVQMMERAYVASGLHLDRNPDAEPVPADLDRKYREFLAMPEKDRPGREEYPWLFDLGNRLTPWKPDYSSIEAGKPGEFLEQFLGTDAPYETVYPQQMLLTVDHRDPIGFDGGDPVARAIYNEWEGKPKAKTSDDLTAGRSGVRTRDEGRKRKENCILKKGLIGKILLCAVLLSVCCLGAAACARTFSEGGGKAKDDPAPGTTAASSSELHPSAGTDAAPRTDEVTRPRGSIEYGYEWNSEKDGTVVYGLMHPEEGTEFRAWETLFSGIWFEELVPLSDGSAAAAARDWDSSHGYKGLRLIRFAPDGQILWSLKTTGEDYQYEYPTKVFAADAGDVVVFSSGRKVGQKVPDITRRVTRYGTQGERIYTVEYPSHLDTLIPFGGDYLLSGATAPGKQDFYRVGSGDGKAELLGSTDLNEPGMTCYLDSLAECGGRAAFTVQYYSTEGQHSETPTSRGVIMPALQRCVLSTGSMDVGNIAAVMRETVRSALYIFDPASGSFTRIHRAESSLCGKLSSPDGAGIVWDAEVPDEMRYSPATSSFTVWGWCRVVRLRFDAAGTLTETAETGERAAFRR